MSGTRSPSRKAPATEPETGLLLCAHGAGGGPGSAVAHARRVAAAGIFDEVVAACLFGEPALEAALAGMAAGHVVVLPFLMAAGPTWRALGQRLEAAGGRPGQRVTLCRPAGCHPALSGLIRARALDAASEAGLVPGDCRLLIVAHGTRRDETAARTAREHANRIARAGRFAGVATVFLDQDPGLPETLAAMAGQPGVAVGLFADDGPHARDDARGVIERSGERIVWAGSAGTWPEMTDIVIRVAEDALARAT